MGEECHSKVKDVIIMREYDRGCYDKGHKFNASAKDESHA